MTFVCCATILLFGKTKNKRKKRPGIGHLKQNTQRERNRERVIKREREREGPINRDREKREREIC